MQKVDAIRSGLSSSIKLFGNSEWWSHENGELKHKKS